MVESNTPLLDALKAETKALLALLDDPHPGLMTWQSAVEERMRNMDRIYFED